MKCSPKGRSELVVPTPTRVTEEGALPEEQVEPLQPTMYEGTLTLPDGRQLKLVGASQAIVISQADRIDSAFADPKEALPLPGAISFHHDWTGDCEEAVAALEAAFGSMPPLEMLALLQENLSPDFDSWAESENTLADAVSILEVIAMMVLGTDSDLPETEHFVQPDPEAARVAAAAVVYIAMLDGMSVPIAAADDQSAALSGLAARLGSHERAVRGRQFHELAERINEATLLTPQATKALGGQLGFTYDAVTATRDALHAVVKSHQDETWSTFSALVRASKRGVAPTPDEVSDLRERLSAMPMSYAAIRTVTVAAVSAESGLSEDTTRTILEVFSVSASSETRAQLLENFIRGDNPLRNRQLLRVEADSYFVLTEGILLDEIRRICEDALKGTPQWTSYGRARDKALEDLAKEALSVLFGSRADLYPSLKYRYEGEAYDLSHESTTYKDAPSTEADLLCLIDGVVLSVEAKAGGIRDGSRRGSAVRLKDDLTKTVSEGASQAQRLESLIRANGGLWREDGSWLGVPRAHEFHQVVVCLDVLGPLALNANALVDARALSRGQVPWIVSIHDLLVIADILHRPYQFLTYVRRRTTVEAARWIVAQDELDLLMWFVNGGMYFEVDPDRLFENYPRSRPPTSKDRKEYWNQGATIIHTLTDPLDAYMYWKQGIRDAPAPRPDRKDLPGALRDVAVTMSDQGIGGWLRAAADMDGYSSETLRAILQCINTAITMHSQDGQFHTASFGGMDDTGRWVMIFAAGFENESSRIRMRSYLAAKKHSDGSDRALGVLFDRSRIPVTVAWLEGTVTDDSGLDALARKMGLVPPDRAPRCVPPKPKKRSKRSKRRRQ